MALSSGSIVEILVFVVNGDFGASDEDLLWGSLQENGDVVLLVLGGLDSWVHVSDDHVELDF